MYSRSRGQRSRSGSAAMSMEIVSIAPEPLKRYEQELTQRYLLYSGDEMIAFQGHGFKGQGHRNGGIQIDGSPSKTVLFFYYSVTLARIVFQLIRWIFFHARRDYQSTSPLVGYTSPIRRCRKCTPYHLDTNTTESTKNTKHSHFYLIYDM